MARRYQPPTDADRRRRRLAERRRRAAGRAYNRRRNTVWKIVMRAKARGDLVPTPCPCGCGTPLERLEAHHDDYSRPLDVVWVCRTEHRRRDREPFGRAA